MDNKQTYEDFQNRRKRDNNIWGRFSKQVKPFHIFLILMLIFLGHSLVTSGSISGSLFWGIIVAVIVFMIFTAMRNTSERILIPEHIIKQIAQEALDEKKKKGREIPFDAKVRVTLVGEPIYKQDYISGVSQYIKREVGFEVIRSGYKKKGVIGIHPYDGTVLGIRFENLGYTGKESKDRVIIPAKVLDNND